jgi:MFS family permease
MTQSSTLSYQGSRPLIGLLAGHTVSLTGNMLTLVALPLYVLAETGSASATGLAGFFAYLPVVIGGPLGGVLVDRFGYRRSSVTADLVSAGTIGSVPLLDGTFGLPLWLLFALVFVSGLLDTPGQTARSALVPDVATAAGIPLERAVGWFEATERAARLIGALLAGFLVLALGALPVLALDAGTFVISAALVAILVPRGFDLDARGHSTRPDDAPRGYWRQLAEGFAFTVREPLLRAVVLLVIITNLFDAAKTTVILPVYAQRELGGALALGVLVAATGAGALVGSLAFGAIGHRLPRRRTFVLAFALAGAPPYFAIAVGLPLPALLTVAVLAGCAAGAINPIIGTIELERVPAGMRARVFGLIGAGCWAAMPLGALLAGVAIERLGMTTTVVVVGVAYLLVTLTPLLGGPWRDMDCV